ncbi:alpha/beta fold hydrolase [Pseudodesulfovibrio piezophilus]|nr:alpha/beta fold hydrolase [Pseudodesulfovibrio piezophilus]
MRFTLAFTFFVLFLPILSAGAADYDYPFDNPYKATVYGTPPESRYRVSNPVKPEIRSLRIEGRQVPNVFSYSRDMYYTTALQDTAAPLLFLIAGTGAEHNSLKMAFLTQVFHEAGFHVVALSSPTHMNFIVSASEHGVPGYVPYDVADLYKVMQWIKTDVEKECDITGYSMAGYSLGALHAAFIAHADSTLKDFGFQKVLMINPPVSLYSSVTRLDAWLTDENLGDTTVREQIEKVIDRFSEYYRTADVTDLDDDFLYRMVTRVNFRDKDLKTLIGGAFRTSSASMIFASDVCLRAEYLVPPQDYPLKTGTSLLPYAQQAFDVRFEEYLDEYLLPFIQYMKPGLDRRTVLRQCSLKDISEYLKTTDKIVLIGNRDDVILDRDDLRFIENTFGSRAFLFPTGGHCGNMRHPAFVETMVRMVRP